MYIKKLVLTLYKRLMMSNVRHVEWTPQSHLMIMLGSNGSGKSSILEELSPIPSHHSNFAKGGLKEIHIRFEEKDYVLISRYESGTGRHSFFVGEEDLNPGGTGAVQKQLVEEHFKLDKDTHELLVGIKRFTSMSTRERQQWLTKLTPVDMNYAFGLYRKVNELHRDQKAVIKHITKRMTLENVDLPDDAQLAEQRQNIETLTQQLNQLFQNKKPQIKQAFYSNESAVKQLFGLIEKGKQVLVKYPTLVGDNTSTCRDDYLLNLNELAQTITSHEQMLDHFMHELHEVEQHEPNQEQLLTKEQMMALEASIAELTVKIKTLEDTVTSYQGCFPLVRFDVQGDPEAKLNALFERFSVLIQTFPDNSDDQFNSQKARECSQQLKEHKAKRLFHEAEQIKVSKRIASIKGCQYVVCPNCTHNFQPGVDQAELDHLTQEVSRHGTLIESLDKTIVELEHYMEAFQHYSGFVFQFRGLVSDYAEFKPLWDYCAEHRVMFISPKRYTTDAVKWFNAMQAWINSEGHKANLKRQVNKLDQAKAYDQDAVGFMATKRKQLEASIDERTHLNHEAKKTHRLYKASGDSIESFEDEIKQLIESFMGFYTNLNQQIEYLIQQGIESEIKSLQLQMAQARSVLSQMEIKEHTLKELEVQHNHAVEQQSDYGMLVKAMSPTDGLIGKYLMGFMQSMVGLMNAIIKEVWSHPLEILPSKVDSDELTYTFPLNVNDGALIAPDISRASAGQKDIVDFAFKLLAMKFLKFEQYPLYLDEFGSTFDEKHRFNLVPFLLQLIELNQFNQVFFISHYATTHGAFNQAEFFVVDPTNITVPTIYNEHAIIH